MALKELKVPDSGLIANPAGAENILGFYNDIAQFQKSAKTLLDGNITEMHALVVEYVENKDYPIFRNSPYAFEVVSVTSKSSAGTCTATTKIGTTALGGTANSVSTSEQIQAHTTTNTGVAGDDLKVTISSNSGCEMMEITAIIERPLF